MPNILLKGEIIKKLARGKGVLIATNKRFLFLETHWGDLEVLESLFYDKVSSILVGYAHIAENTPPGIINISAKGGSLYIQNVGDAEALDFCNYIAEKISGVEGHEST